MHEVQIHFFFLWCLFLLERSLRGKFVELEFYLETHITIMTDWYTITRRLLNHCLFVAYGFSLRKMYSSRFELMSNWMSEKKYFSARRKDALKTSVHVNGIQPANKKIYKRIPNLIVAKLKTFVQWFHIDCCRWIEPNTQFYVYIF